MPITPHHSVRRLSQKDFGEIAYRVVGCLFDIHKDYGRLFCEKIYKRELAARMPDVEVEFPISITHGDFATTRFLDVLVAAGAAFELKAVELLTPQHRRQLYNYLLMLDLAHGKLVNLRAAKVQHEFVNSQVRLLERREFVARTDRWDLSVDGSEIIADWMHSLLRDWGTGLSVQIYEAAIIHFIGGEDAVLQDACVRGASEVLGYQPIQLIRPGVAFAITAFHLQSDNWYEVHARRLVANTDLRSMLWVNVEIGRVDFVTI